MIAGYGGSMVRMSNLVFRRSQVRFLLGARKFLLPRALIVYPYSKRKIFPEVYLCCSLVQSLVQ